MLPTFKYSLSRYRGAILGWGISLALMGMYLMPFYNTLAEQRDTLEKLLASYPPELMAFFGDTGTVALFTPEGYLGFEFFSYLPVILGIFAVLAGSGLLSGDEENGTLDLVMSHPISRTTFFAGRALAFVAAAVSILALTWLGMLVGENWSEIDFAWYELARPFVALLAQLLLYGFLGVLFSMILPSRRWASGAAGALLVGSFFVTSLARVNETLEQAARFSPMNYYQSGQAILGLNGEWLGGLLAAALIFVLLAWQRFERRDIRVGGEGGWRLALPWQKPVKAT